ncbi:hypothetical protein BO94DRAFT_581984 [Aspergillus sclerotioniger CBS 115572]|uniref:Uncharacterized protein n=1 Tax=Aspergillus sclerotioniger CBS 115572 TaxID=1450535 RepID=A0A317X7L0_9EURO|nr:hypothetical protein BO94DRAFT_581984 [Aspergillus sclerotioniger CBS 115572]PWY94593.1 hypothetical protein BO94DRAFT_581984 [Aspergillus sclerotioniger CBS 115572]
MSSTSDQTSQPLPSIPNTKSNVFNAKTPDFPNPKESSFTIYHLKRALRSSSNPTDVLNRELIGLARDLDLKNSINPCRFPGDTANDLCMILTAVAEVMADGDTSLGDATTVEKIMVTVSAMVQSLRFKQWMKEMNDYAEGLGGEEKERAGYWSIRKLDEERPWKEREN